MRFGVTRFSHATKPNTFHHYSMNTVTLWYIMLPLLICESDQIIASANPLKPTKPTKLLRENMLPSAPPVKAVVEGVGLVETVVELPLEVEVEFPLAETNTPPAMAGGETLVAFTAAAL